MCCHGVGLQDVVSQPNTDIKCLIKLTNDYSKMTITFICYFALCFLLKFVEIIKIFIKAENNVQQTAKPLFTQTGKILK